MGQQRLATIMALDVEGYSALVQRDRDALLSALNAVFRQVVRPQVATARGRIAKLMGDGAVIEFPSARDALLCAAAIQREMAARAFGTGESPIRLRIGIHAGDVVDESGDLFGDGVNIAARLEAMAAPGGVVLSRLVADLAGSGLPFGVQSDGLHRLKNIDRPVEVLSLMPDGETVADRRARVAQGEEVRFVQADDGVTLAWSAHGEGPPLVAAAAWISRLDLDWRNPSRVAYLEHFTQSRRLVRFDARGNGLSERDLDAMSFDAMVEDLRVVFDAAGIERAPLFGLSQGAPVSVAFAARYPERVSGIVMLGGYAQGRAKRKTEKDRARAEAMQAMVRTGWDDAYPSLRDLMADIIVPLASAEDRRQFARDMREIITPEVMALYRGMLDEIDVVSLLPQVEAPCLVLHCSGDRMQPIEQGRMLAAHLQDARFRAFDSVNHSVTTNDPAWPLIRREIDAFLAGL